MPRLSKRQQWAALKRTVDYDQLLRAQGGRCALCPATGQTRRLNIDHAHRADPMYIRGLLCARCNRALPYWVDAAWLRRAALYLEHAERRSA